MNREEIAALRIELDALSDFELNSLMAVTQEEYRTRRRKRESITVKKIIGLFQLIRGKIKSDAWWKDHRSGGTNE
jgi:hypothetical protein